MSIGLLSILYVAGAGVNLNAALINWRRRHERKGVAMVALALLAIGMWLALGSVEYAARGLQVKYWLMLLRDSISGFYSALIFAFVLDYFQTTGWLVRLRGLMWGSSVANVLLGVTNQWHGLYWSGVTPGPVDTNMVFYTRGPLFEVVNFYFVGLLGLSLAYLLYQVFLSRGRARMNALFLSAALAVPTLVFVLHYLLTDPIASLAALPVGYMCAAGFMDWAIAEELRFLVADRTQTLEEIVTRLNHEILNRERLEQELRQAHESLSQQLAAQSKKLSNLFDLILLGGTDHDLSALARVSLGKIEALLEARGSLYYDCDNDLNLRLAAVSGSGLDPQNLPSPIPAAWLPDHVDARTFTQPGGPEWGGYAALVKRINLASSPLGYLVVYWDAGRSFSLEEIALFNAIADGMGLVLEYTRQQQQHAARAMLEERRRLARDLHDSVTQSLHGLILLTQTAGNVAAQPERLTQILASLQEAARLALKEMRLLLHEMRVSSFEQMSMVELLNHRLESVERRAGIQADLRLDPEAVWPVEWEAQIFPMVNEALNNALKHARASQVEVEIGRQVDCLRVECRDNGIGFDLEATRPGGMGLRNMAERSAKLGAQLEILSRPGAGTTVRLILPPDPRNSA